LSSIANSSHRVFRNPVVRQHIGARLGFAQIGHPEDGDGLQANRPGGIGPRVPSYDSVVTVEYNWSDESEPEHRIRKLLDLPF
jgi:hypothetical protein